MISIFQTADYGNKHPSVDRKSKGISNIGSRKTRGLSTGRMIFRQGQSFDSLRWPDNFKDSSTNAAEPTL
jgi:hypothetical protein